MGAVHPLEYEIREKQHQWETYLWKRARWREQMDAAGVEEDDDQDRIDAELHSPVGPS